MSEWVIENSPPHLFVPTREKIRNLASQLIDQKVASEGLHRFIYTGQCMTPVLRDGDLVFTEKIDPHKLCLGDIIVFLDSGTHYIHRFLFIKNDTQGMGRIITKADSHFKADLPLNFSDFVGRVVEIKVRGKRVNIQKGGFKFLSYWLGLAAILEMAGAAVFNKLHFDLIIRGIPLRIFKKCSLFPKGLLQSFFSRRLR